MNVNFGDKVYRDCMDWSHNDYTYSIIKTETVSWKMLPDLKMNKIEDEEYLEIGIECLYKSTVQWCMDAEIELLVFSKKGKATRMRMAHRFDSDSKSLNFEKLMNIRDFGSIESEDFGTIENEPELRIEVAIRIRDDFGVQLSEFSIPQNSDSEIVCLLDGHLLYVDKYPLICFSSYIRQKLSETNVLEISGNIHEYSDFVDFLRLIYGQNQKITEDNIDGLSLLASKFGVHFLVEKCANFLISTIDLTIDQKLWLAEFYSYPRAQLEILENVRNAEKVQDVLKLKML